MSGLRRLPWSLAEAGLVFVSRMLTAALNATYDLADVCARRARAPGPMTRTSAGEGDPQAPQPP